MDGRSPDESASTTHPGVESAANSETTLPQSVNDSGSRAITAVKDGSEGPADGMQQDIKDPMLKSEYPTQKSTTSSAAADAMKKFKSQSLNSLFRKSASPTPASPPPASTPKLAIADKVTLAKKASPQMASATLARKPLTGSISSATGSYTLAPMNKDGTKSGSEPGSANQSPRPEPASVWHKPQVSGAKLDTAKADDKPIATGVKTGEEILSTPDNSSKTEDKASNASVADKGEGDGKTQNSNEPTKSFSDNDDDSDEEELLKRGITLAHRLSVGEMSKRQFNWDDDEEDTEWAKQLEAMAPKKPSVIKKNEAAGPTSTSKSTSAPWGTVEKDTAKVVSIGDQIKELSEKKEKQQQIHQRVTQSRMARFANRWGGGEPGPTRFSNDARLSGPSGGGPRWGHEDHWRDDGPPRGWRSDRFGGDDWRHDGPPHRWGGRDSWQDEGPPVRRGWRHDQPPPWEHEHDEGSWRDMGPPRHHGGEWREDPHGPPPVDERYRYSDYEKRYRSNVAPPRQELYNAEKGQVEPAPHPVPHRKIPSRLLLNKDIDGEEPPVTPTDETHEGIRRLSQSSAGGSNRRMSVASATSSTKSRQEEQEEYMKSTLERARKRKEEEQRAEAERVNAAKKKAEELAKKMAEEEKKKQEKAAAKRVAAQKAELEKHEAPRNTLSPPTGPAAERGPLTPPTGPAALVKGPKHAARVVQPNKTYSAMASAGLSSKSDNKPETATPAVLLPSAPKIEVELPKISDEITAVSSKDNTSTQDRQAVRSEVKLQIPVATRANRSNSNVSIGDRVIKNVKSIIEDDHEEKDIDAIIGSQREKTSKGPTGKSSSAPTSVVGSRGKSWADLPASKDNKGLWSSPGGGISSGSEVGSGLWSNRRFGSGVYSSGGDNHSGLFDPSSFLTESKGRPLSEGGGRKHHDGGNDDMIGHHRRVFHPHQWDSASDVDSQRSWQGPTTDGARAVRVPASPSPGQNGANGVAGTHGRAQGASPVGAGASTSTSPFATQDGSSTPNGSNGRGFSRFFPIASQDGGDLPETGSPVRNGYRRELGRSVSSELDDFVGDGSGGGVPRVVLPPSSVISPPSAVPGGQSRPLPSYLQSGLGPSVGSLHEKFNRRSELMPPFGSRRGDEDAGFAQIGKERAAAISAAKVNVKQDYTIDLAESAAPIIMTVASEKDSNTLDGGASEHTIAKLPKSWDGDVDNEKPAQWEFEQTPADFGSSAYLLDSSGYTHRKEFENSERMRTEYTWVHLPGMEKLGIHTKSRHAGKLPPRSHHGHITHHGPRGARIKK